MKAFRRVALVFALVITLLAPTFKFEVSADTYVANWGQRGVVATTLSSYAVEFYTDSNATYDVLSKNAGGTSTSLTPTDAPNTALYKALQSVMESNHTHETTYDETRDLYKYTDCVNGNTTGPTCFYTGEQLGKWDSGATWNREHTWPNSKGDGNSEYDIMMLRPTSSSVNSSRGNTAYGQSRGYYDPNQHGQKVRGDVARIVLYVYTRWDSDTNLSHLWGSDGVMENVEVLLEWMEEDPVDTWELGRNDAVQSITGTRNIFVDYPEYAWQLFGREVPTDMQTPSGIAKSGNAVGGQLCEHKNTKTVAKVEATCTTEGKQSYVQCTDCYTVLSGGEKIGALGHDYKDGFCSRCGLEYGSFSNGIVFEFGDKGSAAHLDGSSKSAYTVTSNGAKLQIVNATQFYTGAYDAKGNSCLKIGAKSNVGSFEFTVDANVNKVVIKVAGYKQNTAKITINGGSAQTITTWSDNGEYTEVEVDTSTNKTVKFATTSGGYRCMIDSITLFGDGYVVEGDPVDPEIAELLAKDTLTIAEANKVGNSLGAGVETEKKYYVTGVIDEVSNTTFGNIYIKDDQGNKFYLYGLYNSTGSVRYDSMTVKPVVGDTIKVSGAIINYGGNTPEMSPAYLIEHTQGSGNNTSGGNNTGSGSGSDAEIAELLAKDTLTIAEAIKVANSLGADESTEKKYYVSGTVKEITNTTYGNMIIEDSADNTFTLYGTYSADGSTRYDEMEVQPAVGDSVKIYGAITNYSGTKPEIIDGWIVELVQGGGSGSGSEDNPGSGGNTGNSGDSSTACNHEYGEWYTVKNPTATENGQKYRVCKICRYGEVEIIPALGGNAAGKDNNCNSSLDLGFGGLLIAVISGAAIIRKRKDD